MSRLGRGPWLVISAAVAALLVTPFALAAGEGSPLLGGVRNPSPNETQELSAETEIIANNSTYGTRQSNKSVSGGGAIYGCRSRAGGTEANNEPCIRANNLSDGRAFEFDGNGTEIGVIRSANPAAAPFTTNAKGVATGLNADQVDGKDAAQIVSDVRGLSPFAAVGADGAIGSKRGVTSSKRTGEGAYEVVFENDISACGLSVSVASVEGGATGFSVGTDKKTVTVTTRTASNGASADRPFHLVATC